MNPRTVAAEEPGETDIETYREAAERALLARGPRERWAVRLIELADRYESSVDLQERSHFADAVVRLWIGRDAPQ